LLDLEDGEHWGLGEAAYDVRWEVRDLDTPGQPVVRSGSVATAQRNAYAVHVEVTGLKPSRCYGYRFVLGDYGDEGLTRTAP
jgi:alkaline phosphatase D